MLPILTIGPLVGSPQPSLPPKSKDQLDSQLAESPIPGSPELLQERLHDAESHPTHQMAAEEDVPCVTNKCREVVEIRDLTQQDS